MASEAQEFDMTYKPLLAATYDAELTPLKYPVLCSPKLDGIRCIIKDAQPVTRALKPIPNSDTRSYLSSHLFSWFDGELIVGHPADSKVFNKTTRVVMKQDLLITSDTNLTYYVFDDISVPTISFKHRLVSAQGKINHALLNCDLPIKVELVPHVLVTNEHELMTAYDSYLQLGYEGMMIRDPEAPYKYGRSTQKERILLKMKPQADSEALIIGFEELMVNENASELNELGYARRSSSMAGLLPGDTLGALRVRDLYSEVEFQIGTGFTAVQRELFWRYRERLVGKIVKYKYFPVGVVEKPRHPVFMAFREQIDLGI